MTRQSARRFFGPSLGVATSLFALLAVTALSAQEPSTAGDGPVKKELEAFRRESAKKAPAERLKVYEEGVELVKKSGVVEKALKVGDKAPDFELPDASGNKVRLSNLLKQGPVVVTWYRGGWCPYCNIALRGFQKVLPEIKAEGASLVALSPETPENTGKTSEKDALGFEVLSDAKCQAAHAFGVAYKLPPILVDQFKGRLDLAKYNGDDSHELPLGATYVIDREGVIRYAFVDGDYRKRAEPSEVLAALRGLKKPG